MTFERSGEWKNAVSENKTIELCGERGLFSMTFEPLAKKDRISIIFILPRIQWEIDEDDEVVT